MSVTPLGGGLYEVESQSDNTYFVGLLGGTAVPAPTT